MESTGYRQAVIHIAWFRDHRARHLLFGMVELRPIEFPHADGCALHSHRALSGSRKYLHYRRFVMPATDAIAWYKTAINDGSVTLPCDPEDLRSVDGDRLAAGPFVQEPCWPQSVSSNELFFSPDWMNGARTHFLFRQDALPSEVSTILQVERNRGKLEDWLNFDIVDAYREYQGAMCILAPNPLFRSIERSHLSDPGVNADETVAYKITARSGQLLNGLKLEITNERFCGQLPPIVHMLHENPIAVLHFPTRIYKEGLSITHPGYGLLYWRRPAPLIRSIRTRLGLVRRRKRVDVPAGGRRRPAEQYEVNELDDTMESVIGEVSPNLISRLVDGESRRTRRQLAKDYDQEWFYRTPREATQYVRDKIGSARETVFIVDPYFAGRELLAFGHAIRRSTVHLRILSSTTGLKDSFLGETTTKSALQIQEIRNTTFANYSSKPDIRVLGDQPAVHDRFLVIDGSVWFSGNSLNAIGERAGVIVKLPDPEPVIARLEAFWSQAQTLSDWLAAHADQDVLVADDAQVV